MQDLCSQRQQSLLAKQPRDKRRYMSFLECVATDLSLPLLPHRHFVEHSWEMSASDMLLGVTELANRGEPVPSTRDDVLNVSWHEENCL